MKNYASLSNLESGFFEPSHKAVKCKTDAIAYKLSKAYLNFSEFQKSRPQLCTVQMPKRCYAIV